MEVKIQQKNQAEWLSESVFKIVIKNLTSEFKDDISDQIVSEMI